ncbi:MAG: hypothetical protein LBF01_04095, partial [Bacteroidales bacterium]|nr:hypothetical protein [Bacteroidales bacterium]
MKSRIYILTVIILTLASCRKDIPQLNRPEDYYIGGSFTATFEMFWSGMNYNYVFWEVDTTNWDRVYNEYYPKFKALDTAEVDIDDAKEIAKQYYREITSGLADGHYTVVFDDNSLFNPSNVRKQYYNTPKLWAQYRSDFLNICDIKLSDKEIYIEDNFVAVIGYIPVSGGIVPYFFWSNFYLIQNFLADQTGQL